MDAQFLIEVETLAAVLDQLDYYGVLKITQGAGAAEVKAGYYRESRAYHPDRFAAVESAELRELIGRIYRRINEAYTVLRDDRKRERYLADVTGPDRARKLRFTEVEESAVQSEQKKKLEAMLKALKKGDRVLTTGGIYGTVLGVDGAKAVLRIAEGQKEDIKVEFAKSAIVQVLAEGTH